MRRRAAFQSKGGGRLFDDDVDCSAGVSLPVETGLDRQVNDHALPDGRVCVLYGWLEALVYLSVIDRDRSSVDEVAGARRWG